MKKLTIISVCMVILSSFTLYAGNIGFSVAAGPSLSFIATDGTFEPKPRFGIIVGVLGGYQLDAKLDGMDISLESGLLFALKGFRTEIIGIDTKVNLDYLEIPLMFKAGFETRYDLSPYALVGPIAAFNIFSKAEGSSGGLVGTAGLDDVQVFDLGLLLGAGSQINEV